LFLSPRGDDPRLLSRSSFQFLLQQELEILEALLGDPGLANLRKKTSEHPAVIRYDLVRRYLTEPAGETFRYPDEGEDVLTIGGLLLDSMTINTSETPQQIVAAIDDEVLNQLRKRASDPEQFQDQMVAFKCWNLFRQSGRSGRLVEQDGMPDIALDLDNQPNQWIECKRIRLGTQTTRGRRIIKNANEQIKRANPNGAGAVYVFIERPEHRAVLDDSFPTEIREFINEVDRELGSGHSRSVAAVIVSWDDYMLLGDFPNPVSYFLRHRSVVRTHGEPRQALILPPDILNVGRTVGLRINWSKSTREASSDLPKSIRHKHITATELFRNECELPGYVRAEHAIQAMQNPDMISAYEIGVGAKFMLVTKLITTAKTPFTLLLIANDRDGQLDILLGLRCYPDITKVSESTPYDLFIEFLEKNGFPVRVGEQRGLFIPAAVVQIDKDDPSQVLSAENFNRPFTLCGNIRVRDGVPRVVDVAWAFAIDKEKYDSEVQRHKR
jgi:hypothetical protein